MFWIIFFVILEFLTGSLMFSYWLGMVGKKDLRKVGDGNPGAANLWISSGFKMGLIGVFLDFIKGYIPLVFICQSGLVSGIYLVPVAFAVVLGHAFSPFLHGKGGIAIAVTFGMWSAVSHFQISLAFAVIMALTEVSLMMARRGKPSSSTLDGFFITLGFAVLGLYIIFGPFPASFILLWVCNLALLAYKNKRKIVRVVKFFLHRAELEESELRAS